MDLTDETHGCDKGVWKWGIPSGNLTWLWKISIFHGKIHYKWPFSIATANCSLIIRTLVSYVGELWWTSGLWGTAVPNVQTNPNICLKSLVELGMSMGDPRSKSDLSSHFLIELNGDQHSCCWICCWLGPPLRQRGLISTGRDDSWTCHGTAHHGIRLATR